MEEPYKVSHEEPIILPITEVTARQVYSIHLRHSDPFVHTLSISTAVILVRSSIYYAAVKMQDWINRTEPKR